MKPDCLTDLHGQEFSEGSYVRATGALAFVDAIIDSERFMAIYADGKPGRCYAHNAEVVPVSEFGTDEMRDLRGLRMKLMFDRMGQKEVSDGW